MAPGPTAAAAPGLGTRGGRGVVGGGGGRRGAGGGGGTAAARIVVVVATVTAGALRLLLGGGCVDAGDRATARVDALATAAAARGEEEEAF